MTNENKAFTAVSKIKNELSLKNESEIVAELKKIAAKFQVNLVEIIDIYQVC